MEKKRIVILGGGYGGLVTSQKLAKLLKSNEAEVTLINKHEYHYITTQLHKTGAGTAQDDKITMHIPSLIDTDKINFKKGIVAEVDTAKQMVYLENGEKIHFDYLLVSLGFEVDTFGIPGVEEHAFKIRSFRSTKAIYNHIQHQFEAYLTDKDPSRLTFAVAGAGFTGVEMIGELAEAIPGLCKSYNIPVSAARIINIEAAPAVLPGFDQKAIEFTAKFYKKHGIELMTSTKIQGCSEKEITLDNGTVIPSRTLIWSGGVRGNRLLETMGLPMERTKLKVDKFLRVEGRENIFCIGDSAAFKKNEKEILPPTAQVALQQADVCGLNIAAAIRGESLKEFVYNHKGTVASIGDTAAVGKVFGLTISGLFAAFMKQVIEAKYLFVLGGPVLVAKQFSKLTKPYLKTSSQK